MMIQLPMLWATLLYICGILCGMEFHSWIYPFLATFILICLTLLRHRKYLFTMLAMVFWFILGCTRIGISPKPIFSKVLNEKAEPIREKLHERLKSSGITDESLALSTALLTGEKAFLEKDTRKDYSRTGVSHILALSGMHLCIIYGVIYLLLLRWSRFSQWRWHMLPIILICLWGYAFLAGMPYSLLRSTIMLSVFTIGTLAQYKQPPLHTLSLSALLILLLSPEALFDIGFQLSFTAVFFIATLYPSLRNLWREWRCQWVWNLLGVSFVAQLGTAPLSIYYFHALPFTGFLLSLLIIPLTTLIIYIGLLTLVFPWHVFGNILDLCIKAQTWIIQTWGDIPFLILENLYPSRRQVVLVYILFIIYCLRTGSKTVYLYPHK